MTVADIPQSEADALIALEKHRVSDEKWTYPFPGARIAIPLISANKKEQFVLDVSRRRIDVAAVKFQTRARQIIVLVRLDLGGRPHRNPDDTEVPVPYFHRYRGGYGDKWAMPVPADEFPHLSDSWKTLHDFMTYCKISRKPVIIRGLYT
jgi:hypothetical protein